MEQWEAGSLQGGNMVGQYDMDLTQFSLGRFQHVLETGNLLPSEQILAEDMVERFAVLSSMGISNLQDLTHRLSTKKKLAQFAEESGLPSKYLVVLRRRAGTYAPKPVGLIKFPGIDHAHVERLAAEGIKHSKHLFERAISRKDRAELAAQADVPEDALLELVKLSDLVRAAYVGPVYARILYEAGADTLAKLAESEADELLARMIAVNEEQQITKAAMPDEDLGPWLETVKLIPQVIEY
jgi:hypothetical protein